jgi:pimeloyl-ACP methyl ester carboxylesterase
MRLLSRRSGFHIVVALLTDAPPESSMPRMLALVATILLTLPLAAQTSPAITVDPVQDKAHPASMEAFQLPSHGSLLNALMYEAAGAGPHKTVVLLHGFPGNEKNLDLAQAMRRDGWNVLYFDYRGSWGTPGSFSFAHCMEDAQSALAYLRDPANASRLRVNPEEIALVGHSMGSMIALYTAAHDEKVLEVEAISAANMAGMAMLPPGAPAEAREQLLAGVSKALAAEGMAPLAGCTPEGLAAELMAHPEWSFASDAPGLKSKPTLILTSDDGLAPSAEKLAATIRAEGNQHIKIVHMSTDHSYSDKRIAVEEEILGGLDSLKLP